MGRKVHPYGFRLGVIRDWQSKWYANRDYAVLAKEDMLLRRLIMRTLPMPASPRSSSIGTRTS